MTPYFEPVPTVWQLAGFMMIYIGSLGMFVAYAHCLEDSWKKDLKLFLAMTFLPWTGIGLLAMPAYAMMKFDAVKYRPLLAATAIIGSAMFIFGIRFSMMAAHS